MNECIFCVCAVQGTQSTYPPASLQDQRLAVSSLKRHGRALKSISRATPKTRQNHLLRINTTSFHFLGRTFLYTQEICVLTARNYRQNHFFHAIRINLNFENLNI